MSEELKACPFCGGRPEMGKVAKDYLRSPKCSIHCTECWIEMERIGYADEESLEIATRLEWNTRATNV